jgi:hypothetical protein
MVKTAQGEAKTRLYSTWQNMLRRCYDPRSIAFRYYGAKGVTVCDEWRDFVTFRDWALSYGYQPSLTINRIDNDGHYEPGNCDWRTRREQARNKRNNRMLSAYNQINCLAAWIEDERCVVAYATLRHRLTSGWLPEEALSTPLIAGPQRHLGRDRLQTG